MKPIVKAFFDKTTWTMTYIVYDEKTNDAIIIDPVWDYDQGSSKMSTESINQLSDFIAQKKLDIHYILETHAHADHVTASQVLKQRFPKATVGIGAEIVKVQKVFKDIFNLPTQFKTDGSQFDILLTEEKILHAGSIEIKILPTPGHTPACVSYLIEDCAFTGDVLFMPDSGTGRCDFPAGSAEELYHSVHDKLYKLPESTRVFVGHDYQPNGRRVEFETTIGEQKQKNIHIKLDTSRDQFVEFRTARDKSLAAPRLLLPSVQINIDAGRLPPPDNNGKRYLRIPIFE